jgi:RHS repeat-associated protein
MDGPWLNDLTARDNRYKFNGIERVTDLGLNMDLAPFRSYDPAIGRWWQADPIAKAWESPYAAMYNSPLNWADGMGDNPSSPGILGPRAVAQDSTPRTGWNFLTMPKMQYSTFDRAQMQLGVINSTLLGNTLAETWNGAVGLAYGITHPKQAWNGISNAGSYLWNSSWGQKMDDLNDVGYNSPESFTSLLVPIGAASKVGKLGTFTRKVVQASKIAGGRQVVNLTEETFMQALFKSIENVGGYSIYGTKGLVGKTFNRNIFLLEATAGKSLSGFRALIGKLESEALKAGANKISIFGSSIVNPGFFNPSIAKRFGYTFEKTSNGVIFQKMLKP